MDSIKTNLYIRVKKDNSSRFLIKDYNEHVDDNCFYLAYDIYLIGYTFWLFHLQMIYLTYFFEEN